MSQNESIWYNDKEKRWVQPYTWLDHVVEECIVRKEKRKNCNNFSSRISTIYIVWHSTWQCGGAHSLASLMINTDKLLAHYLPLSVESGTTLHCTHIPQPRRTPRSPAAHTSRQHFASGSAKGTHGSELNAKTLVRILPIIVAPIYHSFTDYMSKCLLAKYFRAQVV